MSVEARQLLAEDSRRTIADKGYIRALIQKWGEFLEGMPDKTEAQRYTLGVTALLMENQAQHLLGLQEDTRTVNVGSFTKFIFPILRRVFPNLIANEIVSVQPMTAPVGAVFYLDAVYGTTKGSTTAGAIFPRDFDRNYTSEYISGEILITGDGTNFGGSGTVVSAQLAFNPVRPLNTSLGYSLIIQEVNPTTAAVVQTATDNGTGGFTFSPTGGSVAGVINYSNGAISGFKFQNVPASGNQILAYYYYDGEANQKIPQFNLDVKQAPVTAIPRRLKSLWSAEAAEDLRAFHGIDAETEMVSMAAQEMALEIDREIVQDLFAASTGTTATFDRVPPAGIPELDNLRSIVTQIATVANLIHKKTLRAPANFIVTSPEISALLAQLTTHGDFRALWVSGGESPYGPADMPRPLTQHGQFGIYKVGTLMNKWMVYEDPFFTRNFMLIGLKGGSFLDCGYVWAPYIPLQVTPTFLDPADMAFRKGFRTRYAKKLTRPEFFGQLNVLNL
jgi:major capsid protein Gp23